MASATPASKTTRIFLWIAVILGGLAIVSAILMGTMMSRMGNAPSDVDYSSTQESDNGLYRVSYTVSTGTVPINQMHEWTLHVESADGTPVENATITVDGDMPQHGHGLPTSPRVTEYLGNGDYRVEGLKFQMGGWWLLDFSISADGQTDAVHFNMMLK